MSVAVQPYRAYRPRPFTKEERTQVAILFGGLHWRAERVIQAVFANQGYLAEVLPTATKEDLLTGRELADIGQCCPTSFTTGNLANFLRRESRRLGRDHVVDKYVYFTAGACGACRFGQYHQSYEMALRNVGFETFRMFLLAQDRLDQGTPNGDGLDINLPFTMGVSRSLAGSACACGRRRSCSILQAWWPESRRGSTPNRPETTHAERTRRPAPENRERYWNITAMPVTTRAPAHTQSRLNHAVRRNASPSLR